MVCSHSCCSQMKVTPDFQSYINRKFPLLLITPDFQSEDQPLYPLADRPMRIGYVSQGIYAFFLKSDSRRACALLYTYDCGGCRKALILDDNDATPRVTHTSCSSYPHPQNNEQRPTTEGVLADRVNAVADAVVTRLLNGTAVPLILRATVDFHPVQLDKRRCLV